jgi:DNA processing protein
MHPDERLAYLTLALTPGIGAVRLAALQERFGSFGGALRAPPQRLREIPGMSLAAATAIADARGSDPAAVVAEASRVGASVLAPCDPDFPAVLSTLSEPPPVLFAVGRLDLLASPAVAVVGTRTPTGAGIEAARAVAASAARAGIVVVSGMARGLDAVAHAAALDSGPGAAGTIGVLGNGHGVVYPAANRGLYDRMAIEGLLLTEHRPGERPHAGSFPRRNRLISGLARVTVVVEAGVDSGALITARCALDQGREVMAVPGPLCSRTNVGSNRLLRDGAGPWLEPDDLFGHYPEVPEAVRAALRAEAEPEQRRGHLREALQRAYDLVDGVPRTADELGEALSLSPPEVLSLLSELEIDGAVEPRAGGFVRGG